MKQLHGVTQYMSCYQCCYVSCYPNDNLLITNGAKTNVCADKQCSLYSVRILHIPGDRECQESST
jgi:hypothetical protein